MDTGIACSAVSAALAGELALTMVLTDRGNGVVAISRVCLVAIPMISPAGWSALQIPLSFRVLDAIKVATRLIGRLPFVGIPGGWCRACADLDVEYLVYHLDS